MMSSEPVVLVVEDEALILLTIADALAEQGFRVVTAMSADEAVKILADEGVDLLFTDIDLPGRKNGKVLAREAQARKPGLKVIYASGRYLSLSAEDMVPGSRYIPKPYRPSRVCSEIAELLS